MLYAYPSEIAERCRRTFNKLFPNARHDDPFLDSSKEWHDGCFEKFCNLLDRLDMREGHSVLYCGTGSGFGTYVISSLVGEKGRVESYEASENAYEEARKRLDKLELSNTKIYKQDIFDAYLQDNSFDRAVVFAGAPYQEGTEKLSKGQKAKIDPKGAVKFFAEKLKPEGRMLIPMGVLHCHWYVICSGEYFLISKENDGLSAEKISDRSTWETLDGKMGFSDEEIDHCRRTEGSFSDDML